MSDFMFGAVSGVIYTGVILLTARLVLRPTREQQRMVNAINTVNGIIAILNDRRGLHIDDLDEIIQEEIANTFLKVVLKNSKGV